MLVGSTLQRAEGETLLAAYTRRASNWGAAPEVVRVYYATPPPSWPVFGQADVLLSFGMMPGQVSAGVFDTAIHTVFGSAPEGVHRWTYWHEPEDDVEEGKFTRKQWRAAYRHIVGICDQYRTTSRRFPTGPVLMGWTANPASGRDVSAYLPNVNFRWVGWDIYPTADVDDIRARYAYAAVASGRAGVHRWSLCETAIDWERPHTEVEKADWLGKAAPVAVALGFTDFCYYDSDATGFDFRLQSPVTWDPMGDLIRGTVTG